MFSRKLGGKKKNAQSPGQRSALWSGGTNLSSLLGSSLAGQDSLSPSTPTSPSAVDQPLLPVPARSQSLGRTSQSGTGVYERSRSIPGQVNLSGAVSENGKYPGQERKGLKPVQVDGMVKPSEAGTLESDAAKEQLVRSITRSLTKKPRSPASRPSDGSDRQCSSRAKNSPSPTSHAAVTSASTHKSKCSKWVLDPRSTFIRWWDVLTIPLLLFTATVTPYEVAFLETGWHSALFWINRAVDLAFILDIAINFRLAYFDTEHSLWVRNPAMIRAKYLKGSFLIDLISVLPFDTVGLVASDQDMAKLKILRVLRIFRLTKLLRVVRTGRVFRRWESSLPINYALLKLLRFLVGTGLLSHWLACAWHLVKLLEAKEENWVTRYFGDAAEDQDAASLYIASLYWSVVTIATVGYGDVVAMTTMERLFLVLSILLGVSVFAYVVGSICGIITGMNEAEADFFTTMDSLNVLLKEAKIPRDVAQRVRSYFRYRRHWHDVAEWHSLLRKMSPALRREVAVFLSTPWTSSVAFFQGCPQAFLMELALKVQSEVFPPMEDILTADHPCTNMYIIKKGVVSTQDMILSAGKVFGEGVLLGERRCFSARSLTFVELYILSPSAAGPLLDQFPAVRQQLRKVLVRKLFRSAVLRHVRAVHEIRDGLRNGQQAIEYLLACGAPGRADDAPAHARSRFKEMTAAEVMSAIMKASLLDGARLEVAARTIQRVYRRHRQQINNASMPCRSRKGQPRGPQGAHKPRAPAKPASCLLSGDSSLAGHSYLSGSFAEGTGSFADRASRSLLEGSVGRVDFSGMSGTDGGRDAGGDAGSGSRRDGGGDSSYSTDEPNTTIRPDKPWGADLMASISAYTSTRLADDSRDDDTSVVDNPGASSTDAGSPAANHKPPATAPHSPSLPPSPLRSRSPHSPPPLLLPLPAPAPLPSLPGPTAAPPPPPPPPDLTPLLSQLATCLTHDVFQQRMQQMEASLVGRLDRLMNRVQRLDARMLALEGAVAASTRAGYSGFGGASAGFNNTNNNLLGGASAGYNGGAGHNSGGGGVGGLFGRDVVNASGAFHPYASARSYESQSREAWSTLREEEGDEEELAQLQQGVQEAMQQQVQGSAWEGLGSVQEEGEGVMCEEVQGGAREEVQRSGGKVVGGRAWEGPKMEEQEGTRGVEGEDAHGRKGDGAEEGMVGVGVPALGEGGSGRLGNEKGMGDGRPEAMGDGAGEGKGGCSMQRERPRSGMSEGMADEETANGVAHLPGSAPPGVTEVEESPIDQDAGTGVEEEAAPVLVVREHRPVVGIPSPLGLNRSPPPEDPSEVPLP
eukprot:jgi/Mesvir1/11911/Mv00251-RA.1